MEAQTLASDYTLEDLSSICYSLEFCISSLFVMISDLLEVVVGVVER